MNAANWSNGVVMSGNFWLDWLLLALSIFNLIIMFWLGSMIFLSAERRTWGVLFAASGLFAGGIFFISHTALIGQNIARFSFGINFWWHLGWAPVIVAPFVWYIVMLWFSGYWQAGDSPLRHRHKPWLAVVVVYAAIILFLLVFQNPMGNLNSASNMDYGSRYNGSWIPMLDFAYPVLILLCIVLSMDALLRPGPSHRLMGKDARVKARPWLIGASFILMVTSAIVGYTIGWVLEHASQASSLPELYGNIAPSLAWFDLVLSMLVTTAVLLVGQAVVSYEIFTGKPLPRRGFRLQWLIALVMSAVISLSTTFIFQAVNTRIYLLVFTAAMVSVFFALFSWRFSEERDQSIRQMRPFLGTQNLASSILGEGSLPVPQGEIQSQFVHLVRDILNLERGSIQLRGRLAGLDFPRLCHPIGDGAFLTWLEDKSQSPIGTEPVSLESPLGAIWMLPLDSQRGMDAVFFLGEKADNGFLSMEELEIARSAGERLVDLLLTTELAHRLVHLQRERFTEQVLLEQAPRRMIHDEVLPQIHAVMLELSSTGSESIPGAINQLSSVHRQLSGLLRDMPATHPEGIAGKGLAASLQEMLLREFPASFHNVNWEVSTAFPEKIGKYAQTTQEVLFFASREAIRNAAKYARSGNNDKVDLVVRFESSDRMRITIEDNGQGFDLEVDQNRGHGLDLHSLMMTIIGGSLIVDTVPGEYTRVVLEV